MIHDLMHKHKLVGLTQQQIEDLLGVPKMDEIKQYMPEWDYIYLLGTHEGIFDTDGVWLCIKFKNNKVAIVRVLSD